MLPQGTISETPEELEELELDGTSAAPTTPSLVGAPPTPKDTVTEQNRRAPSPAPNPANKEKGTLSFTDRMKAKAAEAAQKKVASAKEALGNKVAGLGETGAGKTAQTAAKLAKTGAQAARAFAGDITAIAGLAKQGLAWLNKPENRQKVIAIMIVLFMPLALSAFSLGYALGDNQEGDHPQGVVANSAGLFGGKHCADIMKPTLTTTHKGQQLTLTLSSTQGGFSEEDPLDPNTMLLKDELANGVGHVKSPRESVTFASTWKSLQKKNPAVYTNDWLPYYVTGRWPFVAWAWSGNSTRSGQQNLPPPEAYAMKRIVIYNPDTDKAVLGFILESGPAPWASLGRGAASQHNWSGYRTTDPEGWQGLVVGGPYAAGAGHTGPSIETALGFKAGTAQAKKVVFGFAAEHLQNEKPGPIECKVADSGLGGKSTAATGIYPQKDVVDDRKVNNHGTVKLIEGVPGVRQADGNDCNKGAAATVLLYYAAKNEKYRESIQNEFTTLNSKDQLVNSGTGCSLRTIEIMTNGLQGVTDEGGRVVFKKVTSRPTKQQIKASIDAGDPVIIDQKGVVSDGGHFVVITGYDNETFYVHNPFAWGATTTDTSLGTLHIYTNRGHRDGNPTIRQDALISALENDNGFYAIMRDR